MNTAFFIAITEDRAYCMFFKEMFDNFFNVISPKKDSDRAAVSSPRKLEELPDISEKPAKTGLNSLKFHQTVDVLLARLKNP